MHLTKHLTEPIQLKNNHPPQKKNNPLKQGKFNEVHVLQNEDISTISDGYHDNPLAADVELNERKIYKNGTPYTSSDIEKGTKL